MRLTILLLCAAALMCGAQGAEPQLRGKTLNHQGQFAGQTLSYRSVVEHFSLTPTRHGPLTLVSTSYIAQQAGRQRPVLFVFNGGPLAPSMYLHLLALGPKRLALGDDPQAAPLINNPHSPLDVADLVFYDPAGTGFSRFDADANPTGYFATQSDAEALLAFMRAWVQRHRRQGSPLYLLGESYGSIRAVEAALALSHQDPKLPLKGLFLLGQALNVSSLAGQNPLQAVSDLPTQSALGWYHGKVSHQGRTFEQFMAQSREFAAGPLLKALYLGNRLAEQDRLALANRLSALTGLNTALYLKTGLKVDMATFRENLLADKGLRLGQADGRVTAPLQQDPSTDPSMPLSGPVEKAYLAFAQGFLGLRKLPPYLTDSPVKNPAQWHWGLAPFTRQGYERDLDELMARMPTLKLALGVGYFDTLTPVGASEYLLQQASGPAAQGRLYYYQSGHMSYTSSSELARFSQDLRRFISGD
ncbi:S10 family serine carboxypeptidase-like protein [Gallaecimonas pentaromativorans]|uniref:S10 family serine carboxypeptidase-like protein n=1 Tax=Gallaecimonas pentaromativorans TaxID=584787 RepID=UPI003A91F209